MSRDGLSRVTSRTWASDRVDGDECHGPSLTEPGHWRHSADRVGHHRGVPIEPFSAFEPYGGAGPPERLAGHLLVATPRLADPNFSRRVVLVLDHGAHGALGVVLDRPGGCPGGRAAAPVAAAWPRRPPSSSPVVRWPATPSSAWSGWLPGLVRDGSALCPSGWRMLVDGDRPVGTVDLAADPARMADGVRRGPAVLGLRRLGLGPARGGDRRGSWYVVPAEARDPISADPEGLWRRVLRRQGGALAVVSGFPEDPAMN